MVFTNTDPRGNYYLSTRTKFGFYENLYIRISSIEFVLFGESITYFLSNDFTCFILWFSAEFFIYLLVSNFFVSVLPFRSTNWP